MTEHDLTLISVRTERRAGWTGLIVSMAAVALILWLTPGAVNFAAWPQIRLRAPDFAPLMAQSLLVQFHVVTVAIALVLGPVQFLMPKGTRAHRAIGWIWVSCMFATACATFFIRDINNGGFSTIHLFSVMTFIGVPMAVLAARHGRTAAHTRAMIGLYIGLIIAGLTAIAPGRLVWDMFFS
jgi:uncharacterized membrane protein